MAEPRSSRSKVLVIEDDLDMRIFLCNLLRADGFDPLDAADRMAGVQCARTARPDLIVLDGMLPGQESDKIYRLLKSDPELQHIPVMMMASINEHTFCYYQQCQRLKHSLKIPDPEGFFTIPPEAEEFLGAVRRLVKFSRAL
jgi:CheY-like chemotaxis protein